VEVGEVGIRVGRWARVGWEGESTLPRPQAAPAAGVALEWPAQKARTITCTTRATRTPAPPLDGASRKTRLDKAAAHPARKGHARTEYFGNETDQPAATLDGYAPAERAEAPSEWTFRWMDPFEPGTPIHTWTGKPMPGVTFYPTIRAVVAARGRVVFAVSDGVHGEIVDVSPSGVTRRTETDAGALFETMTVGAAPGSPVAWFSTKPRALLTWVPGEAPREVTTYGQTVGPMTSRGVVLALGAPTRDAVPLVLLEMDRAAVRSIPLQEASTPLDLDGWTAFDVGANLEACAKGVDGELRVAGPKAAKFEIDGAAYEGHELIYLVHAAAGAPPCIAGLQGVVDASGAADKKKSRLVYLAVPRLDAGTGFEEGGTPRVRTVRCGL
jgi:hypothetical protein